MRQGLLNSSDYTALSSSMEPPSRAQSGSNSGSWRVPSSTPLLPDGLGLPKTHLPPIDEGFDQDPSGTPAFERGIVEVRQGAATMDLSSLQTPMTSGQMLRSSAVISLGAALPVIGWSYLASKLTLVRSGELALVRSISGECRALGSGWHLVNTVGCDIVKASMTEPVVRLGILTIIRIIPGQVGKAQINGQPLLLGPGVHLFNDPLFAYLGTEEATSPKISVADTLHVITVGQEQVGLAMMNAVGHLLGPGRHAICHPRFQWVGFKNAKEEYMCVGAKHRVFISEGRLGLAWDGGKPLILEPTEDRKPRCFNSPTFHFERSVSATQQVIKHGSLKVITVRQGFAGVSFRDGELEVLPTGRVILDSVTHAFAGFLPMGQQTLQLDAVDGMTSDNVGLKFDAAICVQVHDAKKAIANLGSTSSNAMEAMGGAEVGFDSECVWTNVKAKARLALSIIIGNQKLNRGDGTEDDSNDGRRAPVYQPGRGGLPPPPPALPSGGGGGGGGKLDIFTSSTPPPTAPPASGVPGTLGDDPSSPHPPPPSNPPYQSQAVSFRTRIHDTFMANFAAAMLSQCGIAVVDMSLEDVRITDRTLAEAMARGAVARADLAKASIERQIKLTTSEAEKASEILRAEGKAQSTQIMAVAEANRVRLLDDQFSLLKSPLSSQREALLAAGEVLKGSSSSLILASSPAEAAAMLGGGGSMNRFLPLGK